jgi:hypothetical protein
VSNGANNVLEQAAARPDASVFLRPSVTAEDDDGEGCLAIGCLAIDFKGAVDDVIESLANEICTDSKNRRYNCATDRMFIAYYDVGGSDCDAVWFCCPRRVHKTLCDITITHS